MPDGSARTRNEAAPAAAGESVEHVDVLIVGAGISGIGAAWHLRNRLPGKSFLMLDALDGHGGTWRTHRYPGARSDSDLFTFGYGFKPWVGPPIATRAEILAYLDEVIADADLGPRIRYRHTVLAAHWSGADRRWTLEVRREDGSEVRFTCNFLWMCQGYYRHDEGHTPDWPGLGEFQGDVVHPQTWPEDLDLAGKRVVVIGSGATAATLIPAIAPVAAHVTMLQRSPTFFIAQRNANAMADELRALDIDPAWIHEIVRRKVLHDQAIFTRRAREEPEAVREELMAGVRAHLGNAAAMDPHFSPTYRPWRQRIAFVPDGDLFKAIGSGRADVVTDRIDRFTPTGIRLASGRELPADVVITATGFHMSALGDIALTVDGAPVDFADTLTWRGAMFTGIPNMAWVFGYLRAAWTLRADLVAEFVCRMLAHMEATGAEAVEVSPRAVEADMPTGPWIDPEDFNPGYLMRGMHLLPRSGPTPEWRHTQDYRREREDFAAVDFSDPVFRYA